VKSFSKVQQEERDAVLARHHDQAKKMTPNIGKPVESESEKNILSKTIYFNFPKVSFLFGSLSKLGNSF